MSVYPGVIDDGAAQILYSVGWEIWQPNNPDPRNYKSTLHSTTLVGAFARVRFTGSRVAVVSTIATGSGRQLSIASFSLDNGNPTTVSVPTLLPVQFQYTFWDSGPINFGSHLLVVTNTGNQTFFRIDHIDYDPTDGNTPKSSSSAPIATEEVMATSTVVVPTTAEFIGPTGTASSIVASTDPSLDMGGTSSSLGLLQTNGVSGSTTASQSLLGSLTSLSPSGTPTGDLADANVATNSKGGSSTSTTAPIGAIAGGITAIVLVFLLVGTLLCFLKRRSRQKEIYLESGGGSPITVRNPTIPTPFKRRTHQPSTSSLVGLNFGRFSNSTNESMTTPTSDRDRPESAFLAMTMSQAGVGFAGGHKHQGSTSTNSSGPGIDSWGSGGGARVGVGVNARAKYAEAMAERQQARMGRGDQNEASPSPSRRPPAFQAQGSQSEVLKRPDASGLTMAEFLDEPEDVDAPSAYYGQSPGRVSTLGGGGGGWTPRRSLFPNRRRETGSV